MSLYATVPSFSPWTVWMTESIKDCGKDEEGGRGKEIPTGE
jgi:hypothetical protein